MLIDFHKASLAEAVKAANRGKTSMAILSLLMMGTPGAFAQTVPTEHRHIGTIEEVIVQARRKDESLQDVPLTVNAVSAEMLDQLNIRKFEDVQSLVAGLTLQEDSIAPNASMRGVRFDTFASGSNPTVEFYLNDSPIVSLSAMQAMFDVGAVEILRGPQGTLRGRASPSGAITITTQRPMLNEFNGYLDVTGTDQGGQNYRGAINIPVIEDKLAFRLAGFYEKNKAAQIKSINGGDEDKYEGSGWRASALFSPTETLTINLMHQEIRPKRTILPQVESAWLADPDVPVGTDPLIKAGDRKAVSDFGERSEQVFKRTGLEIQWELESVQINYAGSYTEQRIDRKQVEDIGNVLKVPNEDRLGQALRVPTRDTAHEIRFSSAEPLFNERLDYVVGAFYKDDTSPSRLQNPLILSTNPLFWLPIDVRRETLSREQSVFANLNFYIGESTELSVGARKIEFDTQSQLFVLGREVAAAAVDDKVNETVYAASLKHEFTDDLMVYASYGTSWRPSATAVGDNSSVRTPRQSSFFKTNPETSESFEIGLKSTWMDNRLRLNLSAYYQEFEDYPYRVGGEGVYFVEDLGNFQQVKKHNFIAGVPLEVKGVELETAFEITQHWSANALLSWSEGKITGGSIPCNDFNPADGQPDLSPGSPTIGEIRAATNGDNIAACDISRELRSNYAPLWTATLQSEYRFDLAGMDAYVRGLISLYGDSQNDPTNRFDDIDAYELVNLYAGVRDPEGAWEVMLYGKNIFNEEVVISRDATVENLGGLVDSEYRRVTLNAPREFGVNLRYNF